jgi:hypothetical protein
MVSVAYFREEQPYVVRFTNVIAHAAQFVILVTFYAALAIETGVMVDFGLQDLGMGLFLCATNVVVLACALWLGWVRYRKDKLRSARVFAKAKKVEWACTFTADKFRTTFEAINQSSVPANHVLCFYYCSRQVVGCGGGVVHLILLLLLLFLFHQLGVLKCVP